LAVSSVAEWAEANGFEAVGNVSLQEQDAFVKQLIQQWVLFRCVFELMLTNISSWKAVAWNHM